MNEVRLVIFRVDQNHEISSSCQKIWWFVVSRVDHQNFRLYLRKPMKSSLNPKKIITSNESPTKTKLSIILISRFATEKTQFTLDIIWNLSEFLIQFYIFPILIFEHFKSKHLYMIIRFMFSSAEFHKKKFQHDRGNINKSFSFEISKKIFICEKSIENYMSF
jgi:hypothetical protein